MASDRKGSSQVAPYEPPALTVVGSVHELTMTHISQNGDGQWCLWNKTIGPPDYFNWIPISNCSP